MDVYLNVAAACGSRSPRPISPLPLPWWSSLVNAPLPTDAVYFGEISLSGAVRPVAQTSARLKEAAKLGFGRRAARIGARDSAAMQVSSSYRGRINQPGRGYRCARHSQRKPAGKQGRRGGGEKCHTYEIPASGRASRA